MLFELGRNIRICEKHVALRSEGLRHLSKAETEKPVVTLMAAVGLDQNAEHCLENTAIA
jgi:hypothetical protein